MCVEARILTCGHEYHTGSLIISFCASLRPQTTGVPHEDNKFITTAGLGVSVATLTPTLTSPFTISLVIILKLDHHSTSLING